MIDEIDMLFEDIMQLDTKKLALEPQLQSNTRKIRSKVYKSSFFYLSQFNNSINFDEVDLEQGLPRKNLHGK